MFLQISKHNLTKGEENALKALTTIEPSIINETEKDGTIVNMNKDYYDENIMNMLSSSEYYSKLT